MKSILLSLVMLFSFSTIAAGQSLNDYRWTSRLVLLFTPAPDDPTFEHQARLLNEQANALKERDVIVLLITPDAFTENTGQFLTEANADKYYDQFGIAKHQVEMILLGLDGGEKFRAQNRVTPPSVLMELIDGMPMRRRELLRNKERKNKGGGRN